MKVNDFSPGEPMAKAALSRREQNKAEKRGRIIAAARALFAHKGFEATTTQQIAEAAGVGAGTLFLYASTKDDLLILVFRQEMIELVERAYQAARRKRVLVDQLIAFFETFVAYHERDLPLARSLMRQLGYVGSADQRSEVSELMTALLRRLALILEAAKGRGEAQLRDSAGRRRSGHLRRLLLQPHQAAQQLPQPRAVRPRPQEPARARLARLLAAAGTARRNLMPARTGQQFLNGLREPREIWVGDDKVADIAGHPAFAGAAEAMAGVFDLQHQHGADCLAPDPETGEPINVSHLIPRSKADIARRHAGLARIAEYTVGVMGRSPDYMNVTYAGFAGRCDEWRAHGNDEGAENLVAYQKHLRRNDISLTHTIIHPTIDKGAGDRIRVGDDVPLHKVGETEHGILVSGARILATLAPFADELAVYPGHPLPEGADDYALAFCIPMTTPGLKFICRDSFSTAAQHARLPTLGALRRAGRVRHFRSASRCRAIGCISTATSRSTTR